MKELYIRRWSWSIRIWRSKPVRLLSSESSNRARLRKFSHSRQEYLSCRSRWVCSIRKFSRSSLLTKQALIKLKSSRENWISQSSCRIMPGKIGPQRARTSPRDWFRRLMGRMCCSSLWQMSTTKKKWRSIQRYKNSRQPFYLKTIHLLSNPCLGTTRTKGDGPTTYPSSTSSPQNL